jgi:type IV pilus assembly protein PilM
MKFTLTRERPLIGLDIGTSAVKAVELRAKKKGKQNVFEVVRIGHEVLPRDAIVEGTIIDGAAVAEAIRGVCDKAKIVGRDMVIAVSGNSVIIKKISLPPMEAEELAESVIWEAKHSIPYPYDETYVDYSILKPALPGEDQNIEILLVAVKKEKINAYANVIRQARKSLEAVEVDAFALHNALEINYPDEFRERIIALVNVGAAITTIVISERGVPQMFRDLPMGGTTFIENIRKEVNVGIEEAERMLKSAAPETVPEYEIDAVLSASLQGLLDEIEKTFTFFEAEDKANKKIEEIHLAGGLSGLKNIGAAFEQKFGIKPVLFDPFRRVFYNEKKLDSVYYQEMAPAFAVATGLGSRLREK